MSSEGRGKQSVRRGCESFKARQYLNVLAKLAEARRVGSAMRGKEENCGK